MIDWCEWIGQSRPPVGIGDGAEGWFADWSAIARPVQRALQRRIIGRRELHPEIVWVLSIVNPLAVAPFAAGEQIGIPARANGPGFRAEHTVDHHVTLAGLSVCHAHDPVGAPETVIAAVAGFMKKLEEDVLVRHELPWAALPVDRIHRCRVGLPGCARPLARYLHVMASVL